ncbi:MAG: NAD(P)/FAD-dependent oxidoreductase [Tyzzerella sp.]|nr:NAD(P)/FAD-dependent oxidoreductase [Tyzzerella sp.]
MKSKHVIIVGGGASGLVAAIAAARNGADVTIIEQKDRVGKKILSTGNGRCNLTNEYMKSECFRGDNTAIVPQVLKQFGYEETLTFFEELGLILKNRQGYIYPISDQASTVLDVLRMEIEHLSVNVVLEECVKDIKKTKKGFAVTTNQSTYFSDAVILAAGGKASPVLGSDGSGYGLAKQFGHTLSPVVPALVQLIGKGNYFKQISGVRTNATVNLYVNDAFVASDTGELQLTNYGISGIPVFQISRYAAKALYEKKRVIAVVDFLPTMTKEELNGFIQKRRESQSYKTAEDFFVGMFHKKLIGMFLKMARISPNQVVETISAKQWEQLLVLFKEFQVEIEGTNSFEQAQICAGGVRTTEVNPETMESIYADGFYLIGELLDIDGICGGYNLQWAWATGYIAGENAAKNVAKGM